MENNHPDHGMTKRLGLWMVMAMWLVLLGLLTMFFGSWGERQHNPNQAVEHRTTADGIREVTLKRNRYGHYVTTGSINGEEVIFIIDTGASDISIPADVAKRLKLKAGVKRYYQTANGPAISYTTRLNRVAIGNIELTKVRASINPNVHNDEILLGMTFLKHLDFSQRGDELTLRQNP